MSRKKTTYEGLPVIDAPLGSKLEITVTAADVKESKKNNPGQCAAARATSRMLKREVRVHLSRTYVKDKVNNKPVWVRYHTPEAISREIISFDRSSVFEPGCYVLGAMPKASRLGMHRGSSHETGESKRKRPHHMTVNVRRSARESQ